MNKPAANQGRDGNRRVEAGRLVYYHQATSPEYWDGIWEKEITPDFYAPFQAGRLYDFERFFIPHLPKQGLILEAGCGMAEWVVALHARGYACLGLDYAFQALSRARRMAGPLPLIAGDLTAIGLAEASLDAVISIGVVEHRREGPQVFLQEMHRILKPGGLLLISVPYFHPLRQRRARRGAYRDDVAGLEFYQYAFTRQEFCQVLEQAGYAVEQVGSYSHQHSLLQELHWLKRCPRLLRKVLLKVSDHIPYVRAELGHMLIVAGRRR